MDESQWTRDELIEMLDTFEEESRETCHACLGSGVYMIPTTGSETHSFHIYPCNLCISFASRSDNEAAIKSVETLRLSNFLRLNRYKYVWVKTGKIIVAHKDGKRYHLWQAIVKLGFNLYHESNYDRVLDVLNKFYSLPDVERAIFSKE